MKRPVICLFLGVCLAVAQGTGFRQFTMSMLGTVSFHEVITGKPYSAKRVDKNVRTLQDGTHITDVSMFLQYRDTEGRTRLDQQVPTMKISDSSLSRSMTPLRVTTILSMHSTRWLIGSR